MSATGKTCYCHESVCDHKLPQVRVHCCTTARFHCPSTSQTTSGTSTTSVTSSVSSSTTVTTTPSSVFVGVHGCADKCDDDTIHFATLPVGDSLSDALLVPFPCSCDDLCGTTGRPDCCPGRLAYCSTTTSATSSQTTTTTSVTTSPTTPLSLLCKANCDSTDIFYDVDAHDNKMCVCNSKICNDPDFSRRALCCSGYHQVCTPCPAYEVAHSNYAITGSIVGYVGDEVMVTCDDGYSTITSGKAETTTCEFISSLKLSDDLAAAFNPIKCFPSACPATEVYQSNVSAIGSITGSTGESVSVRCNDGYVGSGDSVCIGVPGSTQSRFTEVVCRPAPCSPTEVSFSNKKSPGSVLGTTGDSVPVICDAGYYSVKVGSSGSILSQHESTRCVAVVSTEKSEFEVVKCLSSTCPSVGMLHSDHPPAAPIMGETGTTVTVTCNDGYFIGSPGIKSFIASCTGIPGSHESEFVSGSFGKVAGQHCTVSTCPPYGSIANSNFDAAGSITGVTSDSIDVKCDDGFTGSGTTTCTAKSGSASSVFTSIECTRAICSPVKVDHSDHATTDSIKGVLGDKIRVECDDGYIGGGDVHCEAILGTDRAEFSTVTCTPSGCPATQYANSNYASPASIVGVTGNIVNVVCDAGFIGGGSIICEGISGSDDSLFSPAVECTRTECDSTLRANSNYMDGITGLLTNDKVIVTCSDGYHGGGSATCTGVAGTVPASSEIIGGECIPSPCATVMIPNASTDDGYKEHPCELPGPSTSCKRTCYDGFYFPEVTDGTYQGHKMVGSVSCEAVPGSSDVAV